MNLHDKIDKKFPNIKKIMDSQILKHLEFIQNIVTRMCNCSFQIKTIAITLVSTLLAVYAANQNTGFIYTAIIPTICFWFLDAYYLQCEKRYRGLYNDIINSKNTKPFDLSIEKYIGKNYNYWKCFYSKTVIWLYAPLTILLLFITYFVC